MTLQSLPKGGKTVFPSGKRRTESEGLRALAVAPVMLFHAGIPGFDGGFVGVDVFFAISGYLITGILLSRISSRDFSILSFYERRARRLLPAMAAVLVASAVLALFIFVHDDLRKFGQALGANGIFAANLLFARKVGYFDDTEGYAPLLHMWSLAVEEQFYLLLPLCLATLYRWQRLTVPPLLWAGAIAGFAYALAVAMRTPQAAFYLPQTRAWELLAGAASATFSQRQRPTLALIGLAMVLGGIAVAEPTTTLPGPILLLPVIGTCLILVHAAPRSAANRLLSMRPLVAIGGTSYGLYLWHVPLLAFLHYSWLGELPMYLRVASLLVAFALGFASLHLIETPVRKRRLLKRSSSLWVFAAASVALPAGLGLAAYFDRLPSREAANAAALVPETILPEAGVRYVLYGDSHARQYLRAVSQRWQGDALLSANGCMSLPHASNTPEQTPNAAACRALVTKLIAYARRTRPGTVFWAQRWERDLYATGSSESLGWTDGKGLPALLTGIRDVASQLPVGTRLVLVGSIPTAAAAGPAMAGGPARCDRYINVACPSRYPARDAEAREVNAALKAFALGDPRIDFVDPAEVLCNATDCLVRGSQGPVYADATHLTPEYAAAVTALFPAP